jgi:polyketide synthase 12
MGKTDIRTPDQLTGNLTPDRYHPYDLLDATPERLREFLADLHELFSAGRLAPLPVTNYPVCQATDAFRLLSQARHTGKVTLTLPRTLDPDGTVLITGGTGTLGALLAHHLVTAHGVRHLLLLSRSGPDSVGAQQLHDDLTELGATVTITACDTTNRDELKHVIDSAGRPLTAVIHAAGVLADATITNLTADQLDAALAPKIEAAWHLHTLTQHHDLAAFVLFSSAAGTLGSPGQANYAAANTFLDALAHHRLSQGLPAVSLAWGHWARASALTGSLTEQDQQRMARAGIIPMASEQALALFDRALSAGEAVVMPVALNLAALRTMEPPALLRGLVRRPAVRAAAINNGHQTGGAGLAQRLAGLARAEQDSVVLDAVRAQIAVVLGHSAPDTVDTDRSFKEIGFDSLTAVELRNRLGTATGLRLPATLIFDHPTPAALAAQLCAELAPARTDQPIALAELDKLDGVLAAVPADDTARARITERLQAILWKWTDATGSAEVTAGAADLGSATDEELFEELDELDFS